MMGRNLSASAQAGAPPPPPPPASMFGELLVNEPCAPMMPVYAPSEEVSEQALGGPRVEA